jgi:hypothetical protein
MLRFGNGDLMPDTDYGETDKAIVFPSEQLRDGQRVRSRD